MNNRDGVAEESERKVYYYSSFRMKKFSEILLRAFSTRNTWKLTHCRTRSNLPFDPISAILIGVFNAALTIFYSIIYELASLRRRKHESKRENRLDKVTRRSNTELRLAQQMETKAKAEKSSAKKFVQMRISSLSAELFSAFLLPQPT